MLKFTIGIEPRTKKNSSRIIRGTSGKAIVIPSKSFSRYQRDCKLFMPHIEPIDYPVNVKAVYYMATHRQVDITNLHNALHDVLVHYGVLEDDNASIVVSTDGSRVRYDKAHPRTEVEITRSVSEL